MLGIDYNPLTGRFTNRASGKEAGGLNDEGYRVIIINKKRYQASHVAFIIMTGNKPIQVDHINGTRDDNRWENLREVDMTLNSKNRRMRSDNTSGHTGIYQESNGNWRARVKIGGKNKRIGSFQTVDEALVARSKALEEIGGYTTRHGLASL